MLQQLLESTFGGSDIDHLFGPRTPSVSSSSPHWSPYPAFDAATVSNNNAHNVKTSFVFGNNNGKRVPMPPPLSIREPGSGAMSPSQEAYAKYNNGNPTDDTFQKQQPKPRDDGLYPEEKYLRSPEQEKLLPSRQYNITPPAPPIEDQLDGLYLAPTDVSTQPSTMIMPSERWNGGFKYQLYLEERIFKGIIYATVFISLGFALGMHGMVRNLRNKHALADDEKEKDLVQQTSSSEESGDSGAGSGAKGQVKRGKGVTGKGATGKGSGKKGGKK